MNADENYLKILLALFDRLQHAFTLSFAKCGDLRDGNTTFVDSLLFYFIFDIELELLLIRCS